MNMFIEYLPINYNETQKEKFMARIPFSLKIDLEYKLEIYYKEEFQNFRERLTSGTS